MRRQTVIMAGLAAGGLLVLATVNLPDRGPDHQRSDPLAVSPAHRPAAAESGLEAGGGPGAQPLTRAAREGGERRARVRGPAGRGGESAEANRSSPTRPGVPSRMQATVSGETERERVRDGEPPEASTPPGTGGSQPPDALRGTTVVRSDSTPGDDPSDLATAEQGGKTAPIATGEETLGAIADLVVLHTNWVRGEGSDPVVEAIASLSQLQASSQGPTLSELELAIDRVLAAGELMLASNDDAAAADRLLAARDAIRQGRFAEATEAVHELVGAGN